MEFCHAFMDALAKAIMSQEGVMEQWRRFSAEYKRKAMVIARCSVVSVGRTTGDMGVGNRPRVLAMGAAQAFPGQGHFRGGEPTVTK
jgi:hypothetical protein